MGRPTSILITILLTGISPSLIANSFFNQLPDEICNNGLDDDGDGLYDAYDPDCPCLAATEPFFYLSNGDFETIHGCCGSLNSVDDICLENWQVVTASPDYINPFCQATDFGLFDTEGVPYTGGFVGLGPSNEANGDVRTESLGICLSNPLKACREYTITFHSLILSVLDFSPNQEDLFYTIYGLEHCPDTPFDAATSFCNQPESLDAQEIISFNVKDLERDEWVRFVDSFTPNFDIDAIVIYIRCNQNVTVTGMPYLFFDNFEFLTGPVECPISGDIESAGASCSNDYVLTASTVNGEEYQWFKDSIPLMGEESITYVPDPNDVEGSYSVLVSNNVECVFLAPVRLVASGAVTTEIQDSICTGQEYLFGVNSLTEAGIYTRSLGLSPNGCELLERLDLYVYPHINAVFDFSPSLTIPTGSTLTISPEATFLSQIETFIWTEDGQAINTTSPQLVRMSNEPGFVSYSLSYTHSGGCAQTASFTVEWIEDGPRDEDCNNNIDDDQDGLVDTFDDDCPCTIDRINNIEIEEIICFGDTLIFGFEQLSEAGVYQDTFINAVNCDSIITLTLTVKEEPVDTIFIDIKEGEEYDFYGDIYNATGWYFNFDFDNDSGCDSIHVLRLEINIPLKVYIPNAIRLGSSSGNDKFFISANKSVVITDLSIYNRWGNLVHRTDRMELIGDDPYIWDCTFNNQHVAQGLYIYTLSYSDGVMTEQVNGDITVME